MEVVAEVVAEAWLDDAESIVRRLGTDRTSGLAATEAASRLRTVGPNLLDAPPSERWWHRVLRQFTDPLVYLLLAAVAISMVTWVVDGAVGAPFDTIVIAVVLIANAALGFVQEARAEQAVTALQRMAAATSVVVRDGVVMRIAATEVVPGDLLVLAEGDAVSADARLVEAISLEVAEAALTGESQPTPKGITTLAGDVDLAGRANMVFSGTTVTRGRGRAVVTHTGMATEVGRIAHLLEEADEEPTPLQLEMRQVGRVLGAAVLCIAVVVIVAILLTSDVDGLAGAADVLLVGVALAVAAVPEGLPAVLSIVLAIGVQRMARRGAIVKRLSSVETLGSASVICCDKTGTLTRNEMTIRTIVTRSGRVDLVAAPLPPGTGEAMREELRLVLSGGSLASDATLHREGSEWIAHGDPTEVAFLVAERAAGFADERDGRFERVGEVPFTSERKLMSTVHSDAERGGVTVVAKGAPDVLLALATHEQVGHAVVALDDARRRAVLATVEELADQALRTLAVAYRREPVDPAAAADWTAGDVERDLVLAGIVGIIDPPRAEARVSIAEAHRAGLRVVMITGDHPRTAARIAVELGVIDEGGRIVSGVEIDRLDDTAFAEIVRETEVYARVAPDHKLRIIDALRADGSVVAMTGDGVNDAPALKHADIGVAMGVAGTDVAKEAARMILADDNVATIVAAIREGRGIVANIRTFLRYLLSSNMGEVLTMFLGVVGGGLLGLRGFDGAVAVPLLATQILWINLLTDTAPALAMSMEAPPDDVMSQPPRGLTDRLLDRQMQLGILFVGTVMAAVSLLALDIALPGGLVDGTGSLAEARTMAFTTLVLAQLFNCLNARSADASAFRRLFVNRFLWGAVALSLLLQIAVVHLPFMNDAFDTAPLATGDWLLCTGLASGVLWAEELRKLAARRRARRPVDACQNP